MNFKQHTPYAFHRPVGNIEFEIYTDGAYFKQRRLGGWGVVIYQQDKLVKTLNGAQRSQSSLEMELIAAIEAINWFYQNNPKALKNPHQPIALFTDAQILLEGLFCKYPSWQSRQWKTKSGKPVAFSHLWHALHALVINRPVTFYWVKAHSQNPKNQLADQLARKLILASMQSDRANTELSLVKS